MDANPRSEFVDAVIELHTPLEQPSYHRCHIARLERHARGRIEAWRQDYNRVRPHSALGNPTSLRYPYGGRVIPALTPMKENGRAEARPVQAL